ncbi:hypothetical protein TNCV_2709121 [Trichonephila clavipes]|nr:hypothetical protein TNCV_2709121 [Trichonephila clavipes]
MSVRMRLQMVWPMRAAIKILHMVTTLHFQKLLHESNKISAPLGSRHEWYEGNHPDAALLGVGSRRGKTILARGGCSGHTRDPRHVMDFKVNPSCPKCNVTQAALAHILTCTGCLYLNPATALQCSKTRGLKELI